jgi:hypothetical protein
MSLQFRVRFFQNDPASEYESNLLSHCFELFDGLKATLGIENFLAVPYTINEEELYDAIEEELGGEPEDEDFDEFEENIERELALRGDFFSVSELLTLLSGYLTYFQANSSQTFELSPNRRAEGRVIAEDLSGLKNELQRSYEGQARFILY